MALGNEHGVETVDLCFVYEEGFEEEGGDGGAFAENEDRGIEPGGAAGPDGEEGYLEEVRPEEEVEEDE